MRIAITLQNLRGKFRRRPLVHAQDWPKIKIYLQRAGHWRQLSRQNDKVSRFQGFTAKQVCLACWYVHCKLYSTVYVVATPFGNRVLRVFLFLQTHRIVVLSNCRCRVAKILLRAQLLRF